MFTVPNGGSTAFVVDGENWDAHQLLLSVGSTQATASFAMQTNGQSVVNGNPPSAVDEWYRPITTGIGSLHWVRATLISGSTPNGGDVLNTWLALSSIRSWSNTTVGTSVIRSRSSQLRIEIAIDSGGAIIVGTNTLDLIAEVDNS